MPRDSRSKSNLRPRRFRSTRSSRVLIEIRRLQSIISFLIPRAAMQRVIREMLPDSMRIQALAIEALREASELYCVSMFQDAQLCANHGKRKTVMPRDFFLVRRMRGISDML